MKVKDKMIGGVDYGTEFDLYSVAVIILSLIFG